MQHTDTDALMIAKTPLELRLAEIIAPTADGMGYGLVRVRVIGGAETAMTVQIMAEKPDGTMEIDDCAALSGAVSAVLDVEDPIDREYELEVSSPGIDRPLTRVRDFATYAGHRAKIEMALPMETTTGLRRNFKGDLAGLENGVLTLTLDDQGPVSLPLVDMSDAKLIITDALIAESLKKQKVASTQGADEIDYEEASDDADEET